MDLHASLTDLVGECGTTKTTKSKRTKETPWNWNDIHQETFEAIMAMIAIDIVLAYPDFTKEFVIYTDASIDSSMLLLHGITGQSPSSAES